MSVFDPDHQVTCVNSKIVVALERLSGAFNAQRRDEGQEQQLTPLQIKILIFLRFQDKRDHRTVTCLAQRHQMTKATISDSVRVLVQKKMLHKDPCTEDSRRFFLNLTPKGKQASEDVSLFADDILAQVETLPAQEKALLLESLLTLINQLQKVGIISLTQTCFSCRYYENKATASEKESSKNFKNAKHYCGLLGKPLNPIDLRVHCREHESL